jgi:purine nucleosidase
MKVIVDTDTASDDTVALLLAALSDRVDVEAVTVVAGNVSFDDQVENAKYTLSLADATDVPVYEGARDPLVKEFDHAEEVHGPGGLGGDLHPDTGIDSAGGFAPDEIVRRCRESSGEITLLCIGPLTNIALAHAREPDLPELVEEVWVMGGTVAGAGNVTPAAEFNFWVDPDAARRVVEDFDVTLVDWGLCLRDGVLDEEALGTISAAETELADFFETATSATREHDSESDAGGLVLSDALAAALLAYPDLREEVGTYPVEVDEREGLTRGYASVDLEGVTGDPADTRVVRSVDREAFQSVLLALLRERDPDAALD